MVLCDYAGPMIRIIGDRLSWEIKAALLHTIGMLIAKAMLCLSAGLMIRSNHCQNLQSITW